MPTASSLGPRIRTNIPSMQAYDAFLTASSSLSDSQLKLSTGRNINSASDDVSGYITSRSLISKNSTLRSSLLSAGEALNVTAIVQDSLDNIHGLLKEIKSAANLASSDSLGNSEKSALAKGAYRLFEQVQFIVDSTVFGGYQLLSGNFSADWNIGVNGNNEYLDIDLDLSDSNSDLNQNSIFFNLNNVNNTYSARELFLSPNNQEDLSAREFLAKRDQSFVINGAKVFAGVEGLDLDKLNEVTNLDLGIFGGDEIDSFLEDMSDALSNVANAASYVGGVQRRLQSQNLNLQSQIVNYESAISRLDDTDIAKEQLNLIKQSFLQETSLLSITQANASSLDYFRLLNS